MLQTPLKLALILILTFLSTTLLPRVHSNLAFLYSVLFTGFVLLGWLVFLSKSITKNKRSLTLEFLAKGNHWIQLIVQAIIIIYISFHWTNFFHQLPLIFGQIILAYIIEILAGFSKQNHVKLGFGPFPIVISVNLFIWFKDDFFYLQYIMVSLGIIFKYVFTWNMWGRKRHIFNPSAISLCFFSIFLLVTDSTRSLTHAIDVSIKIYPDSAYLLLFLTGLIVQYFFKVTLMTLFGVAALVFFGAFYLESSGMYWFIDSNIPPAVFLGLHLLITDPKTSPQSILGRGLFGFFYGSSIFILFMVLENFGAPTIYDKILFVPFLNLAAPWFDKFSYKLTHNMQGFFTNHAVGRLLSHNLFHMAIWILFFGSLSFLNFFTNKHPGRTFSFWQKTCDQNIERGCHTLLGLQLSECNYGNITACNSLGASIEKYPGPANQLSHLQPSIYYFDKACQTGHALGCLNFLNSFNFNNQVPELAPSVMPALKTTSEQCREGRPDNCYIAGYTFFTGAGIKESKSKAAFLFSQGCEVGSIKSCGMGGHMYLMGDGVARNPDKARTMFSKACEQNDVASCHYLGLIYANGDGVSKNMEKANLLLEKACRLGSGEACAWLEKNS